MKIRMGALRCLLRESGVNDLSQAFAAVQKTGEEAPEKGEEDWQRSADAVSNKRPVQRFFGKKFVDDAIKLYRNLTVPIYVVPVWSYKNSAIDTDLPRAKVENDATQLTRYGVSPERAAELEQARKGGAAIFVALTATLDDNSLPTPWMIVHALFDSDNPLLSQMASDVNDDGAFQEELESSGGMTRTFARALTMGSARNGNLNHGVYTDFIAEIMTQASLTTKGFVYNKTGDPTVDERLGKIARTVTNARQEFEKEVAGKVYIIGVHLLN